MGSHNMQKAIDAKIERACNGDETVAETLSRSGGGLGGAVVHSKDVSNDDLEKVVGKYMMKKIRRSWPEKELGPGVSREGKLVVSGIQLGKFQ